MFPEIDLITLLKQKDRKAFDHIYSNYANCLYGTILKIVKDECTAQDVLQETFVKIWKNFDSYCAEKGRLFTWMINIARNAAVDNIRRKDHVMSTKTYSLEATTEHLHKGTEQKTDNIGINKLISKLSLETQTLINLIYYKGYTQAEAAAVMDMPLGTVKTRLRQTMRHLKHQFAYQKPDYQLAC